MDWLHKFDTFDFDKELVIHMNLSRPIFYLKLVTMGLVEWHEVKNKKKKKGKVDDYF